MHQHSTAQNPITTDTHIWVLSQRCFPRSSVALSSRNLNIHTSSYAFHWSHPHGGSFVETKANTKNYKSNKMQKTNIMRHTNKHLQDHRVDDYDCGRRHYDNNCYVIAKAQNHKIRRCLRYYFVNVFGHHYRDTYRFITHKISNMTSVNGRIVNLP